MRTENKPPDWAATEDDDDFFPFDRSPCVVLSGTGACLVERCTIEVGASAGGFALLAHSKVHLVDSTVTSFGEASGGTVHFDAAPAPRAPDFVMTGNTFSCAYGAATVNGFGGFSFPTHAEDEVKKACADFHALVETKNTAKAKSDVKTTLVVVHSREATTPPVSVVTTTETILMRRRCDSNFTIDALHSALQERGGRAYNLETHFFSDLTGRNLAPLTTIGETAKMNPYPADADVPINIYLVPK